jgi:hypothetical protein
MVLSKKRATTFGLSVILLVVTLATGPAVLAQAAEMGGSKSGSQEAAPQGQGQDLGELGKKLNNPISSVWNITTQSNMYFYKGDLSSAYRGQFVFNFQPVLPLPLTKNWTLIPRPVIPILSNPYSRGVNRATGSLDWSRTGSFGDIALVTLLSPNIPGVILGFGPTFIFPTAPTNDLGQGKFQMGPSVVLGFISKNWVGGGLSPALVVRGGNQGHPGDQPDEYPVLSLPHVARGLAGGFYPQHPYQLAGRRRQPGHLPPGPGRGPDLQAGGRAHPVHPGVPVDARSSGRFRAALQYPLRLQAGAAKPGQEAAF